MNLGMRLIIILSGVFEMSDILKWISILIDENILADF